MTDRRFSLGQKAYHIKAKVKENFFIEKMVMTQYVYNKQRLWCVGIGDRSDSYLFAKRYFVFVDIPNSTDWLCERTTNARIRFTNAQANPYINFPHMPARLFSNLTRHVLSYDVAVNQWITSCPKNHMTTCYITLWREQVTSWRRLCQPCIFYWQLSTLKSIKSNLKWPYDKQNLTWVVISYEIY